MDARTIQQAFNELKVWEKVLSGEYTVVYSKRRLARPQTLSGQPDGTLSEHLWIADAAGQFVAHGHRYLRDLSPEQLARRPDPKRLIVADKMLALRSASLIG